ncbi:MAG: endonuclease Q family protein, partial [Candidatus Aenigmatarchaeota archaeon]
GTGDFTHPKWLEHLKDSLSQSGRTGIYTSEDGFDFVLTTEVSNIFKRNGETRKIHSVLLARNFDQVEQINSFLSKHGNLAEDGRPTFKDLTCAEMVENLKEISPDVEVIPAHIWTPWFSLFGSRSGFDSIEACFEDQTKHINALETGLSSDPGMNWRLSSLDEYTLISNSDSHSPWPWRIGREANVFELDTVTYDKLLGSIRTGENLRMTVEVNPAYGKYHLDGHRKCDVVMDPREAIKNNNKCPECGNELTIGVEHRVEELADREREFRLEGSPEYIDMMPLAEILSHVLGIKDLYSKTIKKELNKLIQKFGSEFEVLLNADYGDIKDTTKDKVARAIVQNRNETYDVNPGYDGVYGEPIFSFEDKEEQEVQDTGQSTLDDY